MQIYLFTMLLGFAGLCIMAFSGVAGHGHGGHQGGHGHGGLHGGHDVGDINVHGLGGHGAGHAGHLGGGHAGHAGHVGHAGPAHAGHGHAGHGHDTHAGHGHAAHGHGDHDFARAAGNWFLSFLSPRVLFSVLVGLGASGLLLDPLLPRVLLPFAALAGGIGFEVLAVRPVWNFFFRFASEPALTLESAVTDVATAVTGFNPDGEGLIRIELDGQVVQLLARLGPAERAMGIRVHAGDSLVVEEVDPVRNRCVVSLPAAAGYISGA
jgi:hypothetical protein